jgi:hypothetical protein
MRQFINALGALWEVFIPGFAERWAKRRGHWCYQHNCAMDNMPMGWTCFECWLISGPFGYVFDKRNKEGVYNAER